MDNKEVPRDLWVSSALPQVVWIVSVISCRECGKTNRNWSHKMTLVVNEMSLSESDGTCKIFLLEVFLKIVHALHTHQHIIPVGEKARVVVVITEAVSPSEL